MLRGRWSMNADFRMSSRIFRGGASMEALLGDGPSERRSLVCALSGNENGIILWRDGPRADTVCKSGTDAPGLLSAQRWRMRLDIASRTKG